jgi:hypothetical protein
VQHPQLKLLATNIGDGQENFEIRSGKTALLFLEHCIDLGG